MPPINLPHTCFQCVWNVAFTLKQSVQYVQEDAELLSCARVMHATAEASREHLGPWEVKQYALQVSLFFPQCLVHHAWHLLHACVALSIDTFPMNSSSTIFTAR